LAMSNAPRFAVWFAIAGIITSGATCSDGPNAGAPAEEEDAVVSEARAGTVPVSTVRSTRSLLLTSGARAALETDFAYLSVPPGTVPTGAVAVILNARNGGRVVVSMRNGGFDPVPITAKEGDVLQIRILGPGGAVEASFNRTVPKRRAPRVVRTAPPRGKTDVPINQSIVVVFSEPVAAATVTTSSVQLFRGAQAVSGAVRLLDGAGGVAVGFTPSALLAPNTEYRLEVTQAVRDLDGDALDGTVTTTFRTGQASTGAAASVFVSPDSAVITDLTYQMSAMVEDAAGNVLANEPIAWSTTDPSGLGVSSSGLLTALAEGEYDVIARAGDAVGSAHVFVRPAGTAQSVQVVPQTASVPSQDTIVVAAMTRDGSGRLLRRDVTWSTSDPALASVVPRGIRPLGERAEATALVIGMNAGDVTITASNGPLSATSAVTVGAPRAVASVSLAPASTDLVVRGTAKLMATLRDANGRLIHVRPVTWTTADPAVATVDATGLVTATGAGSTTITATSEGVSASAAVRVGTLDIRSVAAGVHHSCGLDHGGRPYCWGELSAPGTGTFFQSSAPRPIGGAFTFVGLTSGFNFTCGLDAAGAAYCWGSNVSGKLGAGSNAGFSVEPVAVAGGHTFTSLTAGFDHACAVTASGAAYCWGDNSAGQFGSGGRAPSAVPRASGGGLAFASLSVGWMHTCGVTPSGAAYCWGFNGRGQLGNGSNAESLVPVAVTGGLTFASLSAGPDHTCGVTATAQAYCWGSDHYGQLGDGSGNRTTNFSLDPTAVHGNLAFASVDVGGTHTCALTTNNAGYCWGAGFFGQLGDGTPLASDKFSVVPVAVAGALTFSSVSVGAQHACGMTTTGVAYCWGANGGGQLGDGSTINRSAPTKVTGQP
jgi:alpha-tubulin suppressor-like RCC1 family protein/uncharacterized protein YjdB